MQNNATSTGGEDMYMSWLLKHRNVSCMDFKYYIPIHNKTISFFSCTLLAGQSNR